MPVQMRREDRDDDRVLLEPNIQELIHLAMSLLDVPPGGADPISIRSLLNGRCPMLSALAELPMDLSENGAEHKNASAGITSPYLAWYSVQMLSMVISNTSLKLHNLCNKFRLKTPPTE
jgi:hypothetical protein